MANDLTNIMPKILARGLMQLRPRLLMPRLVNGSYSSEAAQKGQTIDIPIAASQTATDVTPSNTPPTPSNTTPDVVQVSLNNWKKTNFFLTDKDLVEIDRNKHFVPGQVESAVIALAEAINQDIFAEYTFFYGYAGTAGTTPFASDYSDAASVRKQLNQQKAPKQNRRFVLDFDAEENAIQLEPFRQYSSSDDRNVIIEGEIGRKLGFDWYADHDVPTHTAGTGTGYLVNSTQLDVGDKTIPVDTGSGTVVVGDIITFADHAQTYVITTADASPTSLAIEPGLAVAVANNTAITIEGDHVVNLAFHPDAIAFAMRPLMASTQDLQLGSRIMSMQDPQTGIVLRLEVSRQYKQVVWEFDVLWGAKAVRRELGARLAG